MADPVVTITNGVPTAGTGTITTLGQTLVDGANATMGISTGAAVVTDAAGTLQQYLRGLVKLIAAGINVVITNANSNGRALPSASAPVVLNSMTYKSILASQTAALFGATGASGDYLDGVLIVPATAAAGAVTIQDAAGTAITIFAGGGTTALPTLAPFYVPIGAVSSGGAGGWKVTTGTNVSVIGVGNFT